MGDRHCIDCGHRAAQRARFCEQCGASLTATATALRAPSTLETRILEERSGIEGERKQVTVMYTDVVGSMALTHQLDAERWGDVLDRFLSIAATAVHRFEGTVNQFTGDGLLAVFGAPLAHEDHARRACLAVLELQRQVAVLAADVARRDSAAFAVRCGLNSGEVVIGAIGDDVHMDFVPIGNTTALGKRIESLAPTGSTAISASTAALVEGEFELRELGDFEVKGAEGRQRVLELVGPGPVQTRLAGVAAARGLSPFTGREAPSAQLERLLGLTLGGDGRAVGIGGDAGVGKSRLVHEFTEHCAARGVIVHATAGVAHGRYVPFLPVLALYRDIFGISDRDGAAIARERIDQTVRALDPGLAADLPLMFEFLGVADAGTPLAEPDPVAHRRRLLAMAARIVTQRSRDEPMVLVIEDLHWLDEASDAFLDELVDAITGTHTLLVGTYRPRYDARWPTTPPNVELALGPLEPAATDALLGELLGRDPSVGELRTLIESRTAGNPFFIEEVVRTLVETGHLSGNPGAYRLEAGLEDLVLPPTVQAGLAARIDRLPAREKALVQTMSVIGRESPASLLAAVCDLEHRELDDAIAALAEAQLLVARGAGGDREYAFRHPLTQEVAYGSQLSGRRARAHRAVAAAIEAAQPAGIDARAALLAHHHEAAGDTLTAAGWHARAATWAEYASPADGIRHWRRVRHLTAALDAGPGNDALAMQAGVGILALSWRLGIAPDEMAAIRAEVTSDAERLAIDLYFAGTLMHSGHEREGLDGFRGVTRAALDADDPGLVLTASTGVAYASWVAGSLEEAAQTLDGALALADDDPGTGAGLAFVCPLAQAYADRGHCAGYLGDVEEARRRFTRAIELTRAHGDPLSESASYGKLALLEADLGNHDAAIAAATLGLEVAERSGDVSHAIACSVPIAAAQAGSGRPSDALARAEANLATIRAQRIALYFEPLLLATIARCRLAEGALDEALAAAEEAVGIADARRLGTCALSAPIALAQVLRATQGADAGARVDAVLSRALRVARESHAHAFEPQIRRELAALAELRGVRLA